MSGGNVGLYIELTAKERANDRVRNPESLAIMAERGRPDSGGVGNAVEGVARHGGVDRADRFPLGKSARTIDRDGREPFEGAHRQVVPLTHSDHGGIGSESPHNRVLGDRHRVFFSLIKTAAELPIH